MERIGDWWSSFVFTSKPDYILACKTQSTKGKQKHWSKSNHGNLGKQKAQVLSQLAKLDAVHESRTLTEEESIMKASLLMEYEEKIKNEEVAWRQRSGVLWLKEGDRHTIFLHKLANAHKRNKNIDHLVIQDEIVEDQERIKEGITNFCRKSYSDTLGQRPTTDLINCPVIAEEVKETLQCEFEEEKVFSCLKMRAIDKTGPDGYTMGFFIKCLDVLKEDIMETFRNFHSLGVFEKVSLGHTLP